MGKLRMLWEFSVTWGVSEKLLIVGTDRTPPSTVSVRIQFVMGGKSLPNKSIKLLKDYYFYNVIWPFKHKFILLTNSLTEFLCPLPCPSSHHPCWSFLVAVCYTSPYLPPLQPSDWMLCAGPWESSVEYTSLLPDPIKLAA